jgi:hypothetical protein
MNLAVVKNLSRPNYLFTMIGASFLFFDFNYYVMVTLPGTRDLMCVIGAGLTFWNIVFSVILSLLFGVMLVGVIELYRMKKSKVVVGSLSGVGLLLGSMTIFCTACTIPVFTVFGAAISLSFFTSYQIVFKILSILAMLWGLNLLNKQLNDECKVCKRF